MLSVNFAVEVFWSRYGEDVTRCPAYGPLAEMPSLKLELIEIQPEMNKVEKLQESQAFGGIVGVSSITSYLSRESLFRRRLPSLFDRL